MLKKILIADDETHLVDMIKMRLEANGYETITAYDGLETLDKVQKETPDLILLDIMMPKMDGYVALSKLKEAEETSDIPVIMLTAKAQSEDLARSMELGAVDYIVKPFNPVLMLQKISKALSS